MKVNESVQPKGKVEMFVTKGKPIVTPGKLLWEARGLKVYDSADIDFRPTVILDQEVIHNIIVNLGKDRIVQSLVSGFINPVCRMAMAIAEQYRLTKPSQKFQPLP